jgi:hypothetical protein
VALTPSYKESFDVHGNTATVYFECNYFNVAIDPVTQKPLWAPVSHASFTGSARKVNGHWLFSYANGAVPPVPIPRGSLALLTSGEKSGLKKECAGLVAG